MLEHILFYIRWLITQINTLLNTTTYNSRLLMSRTLRLEDLSYLLEVQKVNVNYHHPAIPGELYINQINL